MKQEEEHTYGITLHRGAGIEHIDRERKTATDSKGRKHSYDVLIIATGSQPAKLKDLPDMRGLYSPCAAATMPII